jgi:anhydro-N-acetylmuramic acid kinase
MRIYRVIGLMSGTSLDGIDLAYCILKEAEGKWTYDIVHTETSSYSSDWKKKLTGLIDAGQKELSEADIEYAHLLADTINIFLKDIGETPDLISSHGHTIIHKPKEGKTLQIGDGSVISRLTGYPVVYDFRSKDVALGGEGAPLVPVGDRLLFNNYDYCLNLGGFSNISLEIENNRIAFDICPVNMILNYLAEQKGHSFDYNGNIARSGEINNSLLSELNGLEFYNQTYPKSLGKEWFSECFLPVMEKFNISTEDKLRTATEHISQQISKTLNTFDKKNVLITGGGVYNKFLLSRIKEQTRVGIEIPENKIVEFKEALVFALLGVLRIRNEINCLKTVTGAKSDSICGRISY